MPVFAVSENTARASAFRRTGRPAVFTQHYRAEFHGESIGLSTIVAGASLSRW